MLTRPPSDADHKRALRRERKRRRARRAEAGLACCIVEYDDAMLQFLIATHWLEDADADDPVSFSGRYVAMARGRPRRDVAMGGEAFELKALGVHKKRGHTEVIVRHSMERGLHQRVNALFRRTR
jgi:hypothetical protein